jgi:type I restriction enzyme S subunit
MSFPRYPEYKASGVAWLGDVPAHWEIDRLKRVASVLPSNVDKKSYEDDISVRLCNYTDVYYNDAITSEMELMAATATVEQVEKFTLRAGDTIITKDSETADDIAISAYVPFDLPGVVCGYHLSLIRPSAASAGAFIKRLFDSTFVRSAVAVRANGLTRVGLGQYALDNLEIPSPPVVEQRIITAFLDRETAKIDALVAEQRRLMDLLKEKRQAVISHAVTKGLNPDAPMKDSGVEGLGEVPLHWLLTPLKHVARIDNSGEYGSEEGEGDFTLPVATTAQIDADGHFSVEQMPRRGFGTTDVARYLCAPGDILVVKSSGSATNIISGKAGLVDKSTPPFVFSNFLLRVVCNQEYALPEYIYLLLRSNLTRKRVERMCSTTTYPNLRVGEYTSAPLPLPPLGEQVAISEFLSHEADRIDNLLAEAQVACDLLGERRSALISAAVTGQIDVRGLASGAAA